MDFKNILSIFLILFVCYYEKKKSELFVHNELSIIFKNIQVQIVGNLKNIMAYLI